MFMKQGHPLSKYQCHELPSSKYNCNRMLNMLTLCTKSMWPLHLPVIQRAIALDCLVYVSDNPGDYMQTARAMASLNQADGIKARSAIQRHRKRLAVKRQQHSAMHRRSRINDI